MEKRIVLFRGQRNDKKWVFGFLVIREAESPVPESQENYTAYYIVNYDFNGISDTEVIPESVGQFTGLTDKNGVKIFEGDIVLLDHWKSSDLFNYSLPFVVEYYEGEINFKQNGYNNFKGTLNGKLVIEVIGNITDNPELLS